MGFPFSIKRTMRKTDFSLQENKAAVTARLINAFDFATRIEQSLFLFNPKIQASSHLPVQTRLVSDLVGNPEDRFSCLEAQLSLNIAGICE